MPQPRSARFCGAAARALLAATMVALCVSGLSPRTGRAASDIPPEPGAFRLDGPTYSAIVADLAGDGRRELIRLTSWSIDQSRMAVEIWRQQTDGTWAITGPAVAIRRGVSVEEKLRGIRPDPQNMIAVLTNDTARLLLWRQGGREHVLAAVNSSQSVGDQSPCCLTIWEVTSLPRSGEPVLRRLIDTQRGGDVVYAIDMDGDGTDELAIHEPQSPAGGPFISVLRWAGGRFERITSIVNTGDQAQTFALGNSDGLPGDEIGVVGVFGSGAAYGLTRVSLRNGKLHVEPTAEMPSSGAPLTVVPAVGHGPAEIVYGDESAPVTAFSWPADKPMTRVAATSHRGLPVAVIGDGSNARIVLRLLRGSPYTLDLIAPDLSDASVSSVFASVAARPFINSPFDPYVGPWPDPLPAGAAAGEGAGEYAFAGTLIRARIDLPADSQPIAALPGVAPIGTLGREAIWTALAQATPSTQATLRADEQGRRGGPLQHDAVFTVTLAHTSDVLAAEARGGSMQPALVDAVADPSDPTHRTILTGMASFQATIDSPDGSVAQSVAGFPGTFNVLTKNTSSFGGTEIPGPPFRIPIVSVSPSAGNQAFDATLYLVTPAGHGFTASWHVRLLRTPPLLVAEGPFLTLGFGASISGRTDPAAMVTVDGRSVRPDASGHYAIEVPAGFVPRDVRVVARDPIGNVSSTVVSVIAPVDYRRLPWIPIVVALTVVVGGLLFLRTPRGVTRPSTDTPGGGSFEEIDTD